jgi:hypothetical protein
MRSQVGAPPTAVVPSARFARGPACSQRRSLADYLCLPLLLCFSFATVSLSNSVNS